MPTCTATRRRSPSASRWCNRSTTPGTRSHRRPTNRTRIEPMATATTEGSTMSTSLLSYYEAIERASADMLSAARAGDWDLVVKLEGACGLLISQLKQAARGETLQAADAQARNRIMQRILLRDAEIRHLAEPWLEQIDGMLSGRPRILH